MPSLRTEVTEIVTGLGMLGHADPGVALQHRPPQLLNVDDGAWDRVVDAWERREYGQEFHAAFANGTAFLRSRDGLRGRVPARVEWKGPHRPPGYERIPADLRVDHVYLVSCKYLSKILHNASPEALFDEALSGGPTSGRDWYDTVAPTAFRALYREVRDHLAEEVPGLPDDPGGLDREQRRALQGALRSGWPGDASARYLELGAEVAAASAERWRSRLRRKAAREEMVWRLLRLQSAPYFVLGTSDDAVLRVRVGTPWDWRQRFTLCAFDVWPEVAGQPRVGWKAVVRDDDAGGIERPVEGHVEIRWSHGRFGQSPEAKVYLDTSHQSVPGYFPLG